MSANAERMAGIGNCRIVPEISDIVKVFGRRQAYEIL
jgi:hypothetical protein